MIFKGLDLEPIKQRMTAATRGPWEHGDRQSINGIRGAECWRCNLGEDEGGVLTWAGQRDINGEKMLAHVHTRPVPVHPHGIFAVRSSGSLCVVNDTQEYGYITREDADFIAHSRQDVPALIREVERLRARLASIEGN